MADDYYLLILDDGKMFIVLWREDTFSDGLLSSYRWSQIRYCPLWMHHNCLHISSRGSSGQLVVIVPWCIASQSHDDSCHSMDDLSSWEQMTGLTLSTSQWQGRHHVNQRMLSAETWGRESRGQVPGGREEVKLLPAQVLLSPSTLLSSQTHTRQDQIKICNRQGLWGANLNRNILYPYGRGALGNGFGRWIHP